MSKHRDEKWLDEQLRRAVDGTTPVFDAQAWKQRHPAEYEALVARGKRPAGRAVIRRFGRLRRARWGGFALAAAVLVTAGILLLGRLQPPPDKYQSAPEAVGRQSLAEMVSMASLSAAFQRGGMEELGKQCDRAIERLGPRPTHVSVQELLKDINNKG